MSASSEQPAIEPPRDEGLIRFYSSEAEALLAQYRRIDDLLGPASHDHTHSGTLCEVLLRDYFRRVLLPWMGVDKGFIYGRTSDDRGSESSPEIDILIHDQRAYRPIFRMEDFVVIQPEATLGIIQVKKRLTTEGDNPLLNGMLNVMRAKQHLLVQLHRRHADHQSLERACRHVVSMVVGFDGRTRPTTYQTHLTNAFAEFATFATPSCDRVPARFYVLPHFVGSLNGHFCVRRAYDESHANYSCFRSLFGGHNVSAQMLADIAASLIWGDPMMQSRRPPFEYPTGFQHVHNWALA